MCIDVCSWRYAEKGGTGLRTLGEVVTVRCAGPTDSSRRCDGAPIAAVPDDTAEPGQFVRQTTATVWCAGPAAAMQQLVIDEFWAVLGDVSGEDIGGRRGAVDEDACGEDTGGIRSGHAIRRWPEPGPAARDTIGSRYCGRYADRCWPEPGRRGTL